MVISHAKVKQGAGALSSSAVVLQGVALNTDAPCSLQAAMEKQCSQH